jgi:hypothetical protein
MDRWSRAHARISSLLAALVLAGALSGCGGGSSKGGSATFSTASSAADAQSSSAPQTTAQRRLSGPVLSRRQLVAKATAICAHLELELLVVEPKRATAAEIARIVPGRAASEQRAVAELSKLKPPSSLVHEWRQIISYRRTLANELALLGQVAKQNDSVAIKKLGASKKREHDLLLKIAERAGLYKCGIVG